MHQGCLGLRRPTRLCFLALNPSFLGLSFREENVRNCRVREAWAVLVEGPERLLGTAQELPKGADVSSGHSGEGSTEFLVFKICTITFKN